VTTWTVDAFAGDSPREARRLAWARGRWDEQLAGRTVWFVASLPDGREAAWQLRGRLGSGSTEGGIAAGCIVIAIDTALGALGSRLDAMLRGLAAARPTRDDEALYAFACGEGDTLLGAAVGGGDVLVIHDAVAAVTAEAARDRGAHVFWRIDAATSRAHRSAVAAWDFMRPRTRGVDGYVGTWGDPHAGRERIGAVLPSTGAVTARDVGSAHVPAGWSGALADLLVDDRQETVGGTVHARPTVAVR
jgi:hypothetical protein